MTEKNKKLKVLLVSPYDAQKVGGIGTWSKSVLDNYDQETYEIVFLNTANPVKGNLHRGKVSRILIGVEDSLVILIKLFFQLLTKRPDVVHYTSSASMALTKDAVALFLTKKIFHKRFVIHWHFGRIPSICKEKGGEYKKIMKVIYQSDASIVLDKRSLLALQGEGVKNVYEIPNPMTMAIYEATKGIDVLGQNQGREDGYVLFVGHIVETKGVFELVKACAHSTKVKKLVLVGPVIPDVKAALQEEAKIKGNETWLVFAGELERERVYSYYKQCGLFCLPSYSEGFPYVILEAMAFACPIVATDVGAIAEMLEGGSGKVIAPRSIESIQSAISQLFSDKVARDTMAGNAYNRVMNTYTNSVIFSQYCKVWNGIWD